MRILREVDGEPRRGAETGVPDPEPELPFAETAAPQRIDADADRLVPVGVVTPFNPGRTEKKE